MATSDRALVAGSVATTLGWLWLVIFVSPAAYFMLVILFAAAMVIANRR